MKKFLGRVLIMFLLILSVAGLLLWQFPAGHQPTIYLSGIIAKHQRANRIDHPKLYLVGGSNLAYGLDSELIEKEFDVSVVNLGLHGGLGVQFMLNEISSLVHDNDVVILSPEYTLGRGSTKVIREMIELVPFTSDYYEMDALEEISVIISRIESESTRIRQILANGINGFPMKQEAWNSSQLRFNKYGDFIHHLDLPNKTPINQINASFSNSFQLVHSLSAFEKSWYQKKAHFFLTFPPLAESTFRINEEFIRKLSLKFHEDLSMEILGKPQDFMMADSLFYNTIYHPNKSGRHKRTINLIEAIKANKNTMKALESIQRNH